MLSRAGSPQELRGAQGENSPPPTTDIWLWICSWIRESGIVRLGDFRTGWKAVSGGDHQSPCRAGGPGWAAPAEARAQASLAAEQLRNELGCELMPCTVFLKH